MADELTDRFGVLDAACAVVVIVVAVAILVVLAVGFAAFSLWEYLGGKR